MELFLLKQKLADYGQEDFVHVIGRPPARAVRFCILRRMPFGTSPQAFCDENIHAIVSACECDVEFEGSPCSCVATLPVCIETLRHYDRLVAQT